MRYYKIADYGENLFKPIADEGILDIQSDEVTALAKQFKFDNSAREIRDKFLWESEGDISKFPDILTEVGEVCAVKYGAKWKNFLEVAIQGGYIPEKISVTKDTLSKTTLNQVTAFDSDKFVDDTMQTVKGGNGSKIELSTGSLNAEDYRDLKAIILNDIRFELLKTVV